MPRRTVRSWQEAHRNSVEEAQRKSDAAAEQCSALMDEAELLCGISNYEAAKGKHGIAMMLMATALNIVDVEDHKLVTRVHTNWGILSKDYGLRHNDDSIVAEAEASFHRAIESARTAFQDLDLQEVSDNDGQYILSLLVRAQTDLANIEKHRNNLDKALSILVRCMKICKTSENLKKKEADCLLAISQIYDKQNKLPQAEAKCRRAIALLYEVKEHNPTDIQNMQAACSITITCSKISLNWYVSRQGRTKEARPMFFSTVREADATIGETHSQAITARRNLCCFLLTNWEDSNATFFAELRKLEEIISGEHGVGDKDLIEVFYMMGVGEFRVGWYEKCLESFRRVDQLQAANPHWTAETLKIVHESLMLECEGEARLHSRLCEEARAGSRGRDKDEGGSVDLEQENKRLLELARGLILQGTKHALEGKWTPSRVALSRAINRLHSCSLHDGERSTLLVTACDARAEVLLQSEEHCGLNVRGRDGGEAEKDMDSAERELEEAVSKGWIAGSKQAELQERLSATRVRARKVMEASRLSVRASGQVRGEGTDAPQPYKVPAKKFAGIRMTAHGEAALAEGLINDDECPACLEDWTTIDHPVMVLECGHGVCQKCMLDWGEGCLRGFPADEIHQAISRLAVSCPCCRAGVKGGMKALRLAAKEFPG